MTTEPEAKRVETAAGRVSYREAGAGEGKPVILALLDHLGVEKFSVIGHSMGGVVAQAVAAEAGDRAQHMVLSCTHSGSAAPSSQPLSGSYATRIATLETEGSAKYAAARSGMMVADRTRSGLRFRKLPPGLPRRGCGLAQPCCITRTQSRLHPVSNARSCCSPGTGTRLSLNVNPKHWRHSIRQDAISDSRGRGMLRISRWRRPITHT